jgi:hypothetical protein
MLGDSKETSMTANTVWVALAMNNAPTAGVPFINDANEPTIDVTSFFYDSIQKILHVHKGIEFEYSFSPAPGNVTINSPAGVIIMPPGDDLVILTNDLINNSSLILPAIFTDDATAKSVVVADRTFGGCTFKTNAPATGSVSIGFLVIPLGRALQQA